MWEKIKITCIDIIWIIFAVLLAWILLGSSHFINADASWIATYTKSKTLLLVGGVILFGAILYKIYQWLFKLKKIYIKWISAILLCIFFVIELMMLHEFYVIPITDSYKSLDAALSLLAGNIQKIDEFGSYFSYYGNNYFVVLLFRKIYQIFFSLGFNDLYEGMFIINAICIWMSVFLAWMSAKIILGEQKACFSLILMVVNPVFYGCIFWIYTLTFSMPIMMAIVYLSLKLISSNKMVSNIVTSSGIGILTVIGYYLRPTAIFPVIALIIVGICYIKKDRHVQKLCVVMVAFLLCASLSFGYVKSKINLYTEDTSKNLPITHWIMMGLEGDGQYNSKDESFSMSFPDKKSAEKNNIRIIKERVTNMGFTGLLKHSLKKILVTWGDGSHGFMDRLKQDTKFTKMYTYLAEGKTDTMILYCQIYHIILFGLAFITLLWNLKYHDWNAQMQIIGFTVFGGIIFYLLWEAKNVYSIPFLPFVSIMAGKIEYTSREKVIGDLKNKACLKYFLMAIIVITVITGIQQFKNYTSAMRIDRHYTINMYSNPTCEKVKNVAEKERVIEQTFYATEPFNKVYIRANQIVDTSAVEKYKIELKSSDGNVILMREVESSDIVSRTGERIKDGYVCLNFDTITPKKKEKYEISISSVYNGSDDSVAWWYRKAEMLDNYEGTLNIDHKINKGDLFLIVSMENVQSYTSPMIYVLSIIILILLEIGVLKLYMKPYNDGCVK